MKTSLIKVYNARYGKWEQNAKVVLFWNGLPKTSFSSGKTTATSAWKLPISAGGGDGAL